MRLKTKINQKEYSIVQGAHFSEEYNETLDSGTIIIDHVNKIKNLKPYDDVFIYDNEFNGYLSRKKQLKTAVFQTTYEEKTYYDGFIKLSSDEANAFVKTNSIKFSFNAEKDGEKTGELVSYTIEEKTFSASIPVSSYVPFYDVNLTVEIGKDLIVEKVEQKGSKEQTYKELTTSFFTYDALLGTLKIESTSNYANDETIFKIYYTKKEIVGNYELKKSSSLEYLYLESENFDTITLKYNPQSAGYTFQITDEYLPNEYGKIKDIIIESFSLYFTNLSDDYQMSTVPVNYMEKATNSNYNKHVFEIDTDFESSEIVKIDDFNFEFELYFDSRVNIHWAYHTKWRCTFKNNDWWLENIYAETTPDVVEGDENVKKRVKILCNDAENYSDVLEMTTGGKGLFFIKEVIENEIYEINENDEIIDNSTPLETVINYDGLITDITENEETGRLEDYNIVDEGDEATFTYIYFYKKSETPYDVYNSITSSTVKNKFFISTNDITKSEDLKNIISSEKIVLEYVLVNKNTLRSYPQTIELKILKENEKYFLISKDSKINFPKLEITFLNNECMVIVDSLYDSSSASFYFRNPQIKNFDFNIQNEIVDNQNKFYRHLLVDQFSEEIINLKDKIYKYKIELFSETKGLEIVQLPNISITQPLKYEYKKSVWHYINYFVDTYSPKIKVCTNENKNIWRYINKYSVDENLKEIFDNVYAPDFSLNNPNLRDVLSQLMITKDCIPVVKDNVVTYMDITLRGKQYNIENHPHVNYISSSLTSDNFVNNLKTQYSNALSQDNSCRYIEYLGFRNSDDPILTLENMRIETSFPIYKINKIYMCYYKKMKLKKINSDGIEEYSKYDDGTIKEKIFLCKQDITPIVLLDSLRNILSKDWDDLNENYPKNIEEMAQYKMMTIGYNIGSNFITGWGTKYSYPQAFWDKTKTYVENILDVLDYNNPFGIYGPNFLFDQNSADINEYPEIDDIKNTIVTPFSGSVSEVINGELQPLSFKALFFEIDYNGFYNGTVIQSRKNYIGEITTNDNQSSSLTLLEKSGLYQQEKLNRYGNKGYKIPGRYFNPQQMMSLSDVFTIDDDDDVIIYHRDYTIFDSVVNCNYYGMKDYVLKNYFTSVYAKHRPFNLMSYGESIVRAENKKVFLIISKDDSIYEKNNEIIQFENFKNSAIQSILSFWNPSPEYISVNFKNLEDNINYGYISYNNSLYACDVNSFVCGNSLCFNLRMKDNISSGVYIKKHDSQVYEYNGILGLLKQIKEDITDVVDDLRGSTESYYSIIDNKDTGFTEKMGFYVAHAKTSNFNKTLYDGAVLDKKADGEYFNNITNVEKGPYSVLFKLPYIPKDIYEFKNVIGNEFNINKDNKELIDMTFQIELINKSDDVFFSDLMLKLSDLTHFFNKRMVEQRFGDIKAITAKQSTLWAGRYNEHDDIRIQPFIGLEFTNDTLSELKSGAEFNGLKFDNVSFSFLENEAYDTTIKTKNVIQGYKLTLKEAKEYIKNATEEYFIISCLQEVKVSEIEYTGSEEIKTYIDNVDVKFKKISQVGKNSLNSDVVTMFANTNLKLINANDEYSKVEFSNFGNYTEEGSVSEPWKQTIIKYNYKYDADGNVIDFSRAYYFASNSYMYANPSGSFFQYWNDWDQRNYIYFASDMSVGLGTDIKYYGINTYLILSQDELRHNYYDEILPKSLEETYNGESLNYKGLVPGADISKYFSFKQEGNGSEYLYLDLSSFTPEQLATFKSAQVWFDDDSDSYKFVFGVNLTEEDITNKYVKIYCSLVSNRDERVYDYKNQVIGTIENYVDSEKNYGEEQYFKKNN